MNDEQQQAAIMAAWLNVVPVGLRRKDNLIQYIPPVRVHGAGGGFVLLDPAILLETGDTLLLETGDRLLLE